MKKRLTGAAMLLCMAGLLTALLVHADARKPADPKAPPLKLAASRIVHVTVYQNDALVTREVDVPEGTGTVELVVSPLPAQTVNTSLYTEGGEGLRVLTTRFRLRPVKEDVREEVRKLENQIRTLQQSAQKIQSEMDTVKANLQMVSKLENFTSASTVNATEKGKLDGDQVITLSDYVMKKRSEHNKELVALQQQLTDNQEQMEFARRQLQELAAGTSKVERDAVIVVEKSNNGGGKVRLNYLVSSAGWRPLYRTRILKDTKGNNKENVQIEYLAGVIQQSGEDWSNVKFTLSTAQPMMNAAPPDLGVLEVALTRNGAPVAGGGRPMPQLPSAGPPSGENFQRELMKQTQDLRSRGQAGYNMKKDAEGQRLFNEAAALEQTNEILWANRDELLKRRKDGGPREGQSVSYALTGTFTVPSRNEEQVLEVARLDLKPEFCYKAVPVLSPHVYRLANLTNSSKYVLLPGEATMYIGTDFVGRMDMPLVAIGEQFTAGFGVDPQLQVTRQMMDKSRTTQGGNQVLKYEYRILVSSFKSEPVKVQVWDRLPKTETETMNVTVMKTVPELSSDAIYVREHKPNNLLRWDLKVDPTQNGEKALAITYEFKMELDRQMGIGGFLSR